MDADNLSAEAVNWTKCIIEFMCSFFYLYLQVCPAATETISDYIVWFQGSGVCMKPPHEVFADSNLYKALPTIMRSGVWTGLKFKGKFHPKEIFNDTMVEVFGDNLQNVRMFLDSLRA